MIILFYIISYYLFRLYIIFTLPDIIFVASFSFCSHFQKLLQSRSLLNTDCQRLHVCDNGQSDASETRRWSSFGKQTSNITASNDLAAWNHERFFNCALVCVSVCTMSARVRVKIFNNFETRQDLWIRDQDKNINTEIFFETKRDFKKSCLILRHP